VCLPAPVRACVCMCVHVCVHICVYRYELSECCECALQDTLHQYQHNCRQYRINQLPFSATRWQFHQYFIKVFCAAFMCLQFGLVIFWQKDFGAKAAHKILVKLPPGGSIGPGYVSQILFFKKFQNC
jgi:hypothetical protein